MEPQPSPPAKKLDEWTAWVDDDYDSSDELYRPLKWFSIMAYMDEKAKANPKTLKETKSK